MDKVVIARLAGGLGNQMFQYAAARALSIHHSCDLLIDTSFLDARSPGIDYTIRSLELDVFSLQILLADRNITEGITRNPLDNFLNKLGLKKWDIEILNEDNSISIKDFFSRQPPIYLLGYWQNEEYFLSIRDILIKEFIPKGELSFFNQELLSVIKNKNSASVHVRRGDYVTNTNASQYHGVCSVEYYQSAIQTLVDEKQVDHFFAFSDDIVWAEENLKFPVPVTFVNHNNGKESFWDLILMSNCKHQIIANSSFSWWGAWLNLNVDKMVIAPQNWFAAGGGNNIVPKNWKRL